MRSADRRIDRYLERVARWAGSAGGTPVTTAAIRLTVVRGSPAADPDSVAGSLAYAFLLEEEGRREAESGEGLILPALPIPRRELRLRPEVLLLLETAGIDPELLVDADVLGLSTLAVAGVSLVLVDTDGRELPAALRRRVVEVVDHHEAAAELPDMVRRVVAPVGSACTLVTEQILERLPSLLDNRLACLLLGPILLDTADLDPEAGRVTERDRRAAERLRSAVGPGYEDLYRRLLEARRLEGLSGPDLLRRDYKELTAGGLRMGISSVPISAQEWQSRELEPANCVRRFALERELDVLAVMLGFRGTGGKFRRQLLLHVRGAAQYRALLEFLEQLGLRLRPLSGLPGTSGGQGGAAGASRGREWHLGAFEQGESGFSRKRLEPELRRFGSARPRVEHGG